MLSAIIVIGFGCVLIVYMGLPSGAAQSPVVATLLGALSAGYLSVIHYWFTGKDGA